MKLFFILAAVLALTNFAQGKIFTRCELAKKLSATFARDKLADWNCLVKHESSYNSGVRGRQNKNGSYDYGIFQINDKYWCKVGQAGGDCNIDCNSKLMDVWVRWFQFEGLRGNFEIVINDTKRLFMN